MKLTNKESRLLLKDAAERLACWVQDEEQAPLSLIKSHIARMKEIADELDLREAQ